MSRRKYNAHTATIVLQHFNATLGEWVDSSPVMCYGKVDEDYQAKRLEAYASSHRPGMVTRISVRRNGT